MKTFLIFLVCISCSTKSYLQVSTVHDTIVENYAGDYKDGKKNGQGRMTYANGTVYDGEWKDDKKNGKGKIIAIDGTSYEGEWKDDIMFGIATIIWSNGSRYVGEVSNNGIKNGKGKIIDIDGTSYEGEWKDDIMFGIATIIWSNGSRYVGEVSNNGIKNGQGILTFVNGSSFKGEFSNDKYKQGVFIDKKPQGVWRTYSGEFNNNELYKGTRTGKVVRSDGAETSYKETGNFLNGNFVSGQSEVNYPVEGIFVIESGEFNGFELINGTKTVKRTSGPTAGKVTIWDVTNGNASKRM